MKLKVHISVVSRSLRVVDLILRTMVSVIALGGCIAPNPSWAGDFKYSTVMACGPKKLTETQALGLRLLEARDYFYIHTSDNGDVVVYSDNQQFPSFRKMTYEQLYVENGGVLSSSRHEVDAAVIYKLRREPGDWVDTVTIDNESLTFVARVSQGGAQFKPRYGVCWYLVK